MKIETTWLAGWPLMMAPPPADGSAPPAWVQLLPLVVLFALMYFVLLRPQMRRQKEQEKLILAEEDAIFGQVRRTEEPQMDEVDLLALKEGLNVPSQSQIQEYLLERRKAELIKKYT